MATSTDIAVTIAPEAAARVAELGLEPQFQQILEHTKQTVPGLKAIEVAFERLVEDPDNPIVVLEAIRALPRPEGDDPTERVDLWTIETFEPDVLRHFIVMTCFESPHEG
jgi:hypothetical protein